MAVHPDRVTIATGQVAGHDKQEGKVCLIIMIMICKIMHANDDDYVKLC